MLRGLAALLALQCVAAVRLGGGGGPLARRRDDLEQRWHPPAVQGWGKKKQPIPRRSLAAAPPTNTTVLHLLDAVGRHWLIYERLTNLFIRSAARVFGRVKACIGVLVDFPPRVMVVTMSGVSMPHRARTPD